MAKPRTYGMRAPAPKMSKQLEKAFWEPARRDHLQQLQRNREKKTRTVVAGQIAKKEEAQP